MIKNVDKFIIFSDLMFGYKNSLEIFNMVYSYFENVFIPKLEKLVEKDKYMIVLLGNVFYGKKNIDVLFFNKVFFLFEKLSKICPIVSLLGSNDVIYGDRNNSILEIFQKITNFYLVKDYTLFEVDEKRVGFLSFGKKEFLNAIKERIDSDNLDVLFTHIPIKEKFKNGISVDYFNNVKKVISGHGDGIEYVMNNFYYLNTLYQVDGKEGRDRKYGFYIYSLSNDKLVFVEAVSIPKVVYFNLSKDNLDDSVIPVIDGNIVYIVIDDYKYFEKARNLVEIYGKYAYKIDIVENYYDFEYFDDSSFGSQNINIGGSMYEILEDYIFNYSNMNDEDKVYVFNLIKSKFPQDKKMKLV